MFVVIENSPGYLPENDPIDCPTYAEAVETIQSLVEECVDANVEEGDTTSEIEWTRNDQNLLAALVSSRRAEIFFEIRQEES